MTNEEIAKDLTAHEHEIGSLKHRVANCEQLQKETSALVRSVDKLANTMEHMVDEQKNQGERLERLENAPADEYKYYKRLIIGCILTSAVTAVITFLLTH